MGASFTMLSLIPPQTFIGFHESQKDAASGAPLAASTSPKPLSKNNLTGEIPERHKEP